MHLHFTVDQNINCFDYWIEGEGQGTLQLVLQGAVMMKEDLLEDNLHCQIIPKSVVFVLSVICDTLDSQNFGIF